MITEKTYLIPETIEEALTFARENIEDFRYVAGGTDVMVNQFTQTDTASCFIDITNITELRGTLRENGFLRIGPLERLEDLERIPEIKTEFPIIPEAARVVGSPLVRKSATIGGNLLCENRCIYYNQSEWWRESAGFCLKCGGDLCIATGGKKACFSEIVSDMAPALISLHAELDLIDIGGEERIKLEDLYSGDGVNPRTISDTAIITSILIPCDRNFKTVFKKLRQRKSLEFTSLTTAVSIDKDNKITIAIAGVDPKVVVVEGTPTDDKAELVKQCLKGSRAIDNDMYTRIYRREMIKVFLRNSFQKLELFDVGAN